MMLTIALVEVSKLKRQSKMEFYIRKVLFDYIGIVHSQLLQVSVTTIAMSKSSKSSNIINSLPHKKEKIKMHEPKDRINIL